MAGGLPTTGGAMGITVTSAGMRGRACAGALALVGMLVLGGCAAQGLPGATGSTPSVDQALATLAAEHAQSVPDSALVTAGTLTVGIDTKAEAVPLYIANAGGAIAGLDVDLASVLAGQMGLKVSFVSVSDPSTALGTTCDVVMNYSGTSTAGAASTGADVTTACSYAETAPALFGKDLSGTLSGSDLSGKKVGVQAGSKSASALEQTDLALQTTGYNNLNDAFSALESGDVDYVLCEAYPGAYLAQSYADISAGGILGNPIPKGIAVLGANADLKQGISDAFSTLQGSGTYDLIRARWVGDLPNLSTSDQVKGVSTKQAIPEAAADASRAPTGGQSAGTSNGTSESAAATGNAGDGSTAGANAVN